MTPCKEFCRRIKLRLDRSLNSSVTPTISQKPYLQFDFIPKKTPLPYSLLGLTPTPFIRPLAGQAVLILPSPFPRDSLVVTLASNLVGGKVFFRSLVSPLIPQLSSFLQPQFKVFGSPLEPILSQ